MNALELLSDVAVEHRPYGMFGDEGRNGPLDRWIQSATDHWDARGDRFCAGSIVHKFAQFGSGNLVHPGAIVGAGAIIGDENEIATSL